MAKSFEIIFEDLRLPPANNHLNENYSIIGTKGEMSCREFPGFGGWLNDIHRLLPLLINSSFHHYPIHTLGPFSPPECPNLVIAQQHLCFISSLSS